MSYARVKATADVLERVPGLKAFTEVLRPEVEPLARRYAVGTVQRLLGFWVCWHMVGGLDALIAAGWPQRTVYQNRIDFLKVFGVEPEVWMPAAAEALAARPPADPS